MSRYVLADKLGDEYAFTESRMYSFLNDKPIHPEKFNHFMDHAYFSATVLFKKLFKEIDCELTATHLDALTAILMHNSLYKFCIAYYKSEKNKPFKAEFHPMGCKFDFSNDRISATLVKPGIIKEMEDFFQQKTSLLYERYRLTGRRLCSLRN